MWRSLFARLETRYPPKRMLRHSLTVSSIGGTARFTWGRRQIPHEELIAVADYLWIDDYSSGTYKSSLSGPYQVAAWRAAANPQSRHCARAALPVTELGWQNGGLEVSGHMYFRSGSS